ncbi:hypothetical protein F511_34206 [Dorcoceras hygrometricum]|uniref:DUF599 domain-containing protein n=1 Tax=Dorcoceras hygrometricum TaxID=472368 RepID=A0A2Z7AZT2_9LAMI|nr:hypothetical protein F511_34206 [Dorcoceras hygrometricum]
MEWKDWYLDVIFVPSGFLIFVSYHIWLWRRVRSQPFTTTVGRNARGRRFWVSSIIKDNVKKDIVAVQTLRNSIMGSSLMATAAVLLCGGMAAFFSSIKEPMNGGHGEFMLALKFVAMMALLIFSFVFFSISIQIMGQVNFLVNCPVEEDSTPEYLTELLERGFSFNMVGNRLFYAAVPLLLWISGPLLVFLCCLAEVIVLYTSDFVLLEDRKVQAQVYGNGLC